MTSITNQIKHDVTLEYHTKLKRNLCRKNHSFRIVAIHMENRRLHRLREVRAVQRSAVLRRHSRKTDLVVHHDVNQPSALVGLEVLELQRLVDDSLSGKRRVSVDQNAERPASVNRLIVARKEVVRRK